MKQSEYPMRSVDRVVSILSCLSERGGSSISQISSDTGLPRPTVLRLLDALAGHSFVVKHADLGYRLGPRLVHLVMQNSGFIDLKSAARPVMQRLADQTRETVTLQVLVGSSRMCIEQVESTQELRRVMVLNKPRGLHYGASGRAFLAWMPESKVVELLGPGPFPRLTDNTVTDLGELLSQLRRVREAGYAVTIGEGMTGGAAVAAPILTSGKDVLGVVAILLPIHRTSMDGLVGWAPLVIRAATEIAIACGAVAPTSQASPAVFDQTLGTR